MKWLGHGTDCPYKCINRSGLLNKVVRLKPDRFRRPLSDLQDHLGSFLYIFWLYYSRSGLYNYSKKYLSSDNRYLRSNWVGSGLG